MPRTPDALLVPIPLAAGLGHAAASALLGGVAYCGKDAATGTVFARLDPTGSRLHPKGSPGEGSERYAWFRAAAPDWAPGEPDRPRRDLDCVLVGYLPENAPEIPTDAR